MRCLQGHLLTSEWQVQAISDEGLWVQAKPGPEALACSRRRSSTREMLQREAYETTGSRTMAIVLPLGLVSL